MWWIVAYLCGTALAALVFTNAFRGQETARNNEEYLEFEGRNKDDG